jgi:hypothetical protein
MRAVLLLAAIALSGCATASMVETRGESQYGPTNETRGGRVKYVQNGAEFIVKARREDAYKRMWDQCGGKYRILSEQDVAAGSVGFASASGGRNFAFGSGGNVTAFLKLIDFECEGGAVALRPAPEEPPREEQMVSEGGP